MHRLFQCQARGHDLPEQSGHLLAGQRAGVALLYTPQNLGFTFRTVEEHILTRVGFHLHASHFLGAFRALADQVHDFLIQAINIDPQLPETGLLITHHQPRSFANTVM